MAAKKVETFHITHLSTQFDDPDAQFRKDIEYVLKDVSPDVAGFTEVKPAGRLQLFRNICRDNGYEPITPSNASTPLAAKVSDNNLKVKGRGAIKTVQGVAQRYETRFVTWVRVAWRGQDIYVHEGHWTRTKWGLDRHVTTTNIMAGQVKKHGRGDSISFFAGDINFNATGDERETHRREANAANNVFRENGLLIIFDEFHERPPRTHENGVYDIIGSYRPDKQVKAKRYNVHPQRFSDHRAVSGWYDIDVTKKATVVVGNIGEENETIDRGNNNNNNNNGNDDYVDPDFYATGGNISFDDFLDNDLYPLPYAYGDSDSRNYG